MVTIHETCNVVKTIFLSVIVIMKFNHILNCNHEVVMNILQCLLNSTGQRHVYVKIYSAPRPMN